MAVKTGKADRDPGWILDEDGSVYEGSWDTTRHLGDVH